MLETILDPVRRELLNEERRLLARAQQALLALDLPPDQKQALQRSVAQLDELFLLVVVGEFNAGKSAFINALLGQAVLDEGVTPTTSSVTLVQHGPSSGREVLEAGLLRVTAPVELLRQIHLVDTPGTNAVLREHEKLTSDFVPRADLVLFLTSVDRPFTESERAFLEGIRAWGKKLVVVLNKADILDSAEDVARVRRFVADQARERLGIDPEVFVVSARWAQRAKGDNAEPGLLERSGFPDLEAFLRTRLDETERLRLKLLNPLGVAERIAKEGVGRVEAALAGLEQDLLALREIEAQLDLFEEDQTRDFRFRLADVDNAVLDFEKRGREFLERTLRLGRVFDLINRAKVQAEFEREAVGQLPRLVENRVDAIVDWMVDSEQRQWRALSERLERHSRERGEHLLGRVDPHLERDRKQLLETVKREAWRAVESYDHSAEGKRLASSVRDAVAGTALLQAGALGLGAIVTTLATTTLADVTGILAAGALSVLGLLVIPARRRAAASQLRTQVAELRERLMGSLTAQFTRELERCRQRFREAVAPYTRFVRAEHDRLEGLRAELVTLGADLARLRGRIETL